MRDEDPTQQRHRERLDEPVNANGRGNAAPVLTHLAQRGEIDLEQHRHDHEPDQHRDRQIDLRHGRVADPMKDARQQLAERDADDDTERHPEGKEAFEHTHRRLARRRAAGCGGRFTHDGDPLTRFGGVGAQRRGSQRADRARYSVTRAAACAPRRSPTPRSSRCRGPAPRRRRSRGSRASPQSPHPRSRPRAAWPRCARRK
jgi:hypothetical protein